jgi:hypothetical protein
MIGGHNCWVHRILVEHRCSALLDIAASLSKESVDAGAVLKFRLFLYTGYLFSRQYTPREKFHIAVRLTLPPRNDSAHKILSSTCYGGVDSIHLFSSCYLVLQKQCCQIRFLPVTPSNCLEMLSSFRTSCQAAGRSVY